MSLVVFNTLTRRKEKFQPKIAGKVSIYSCGPTVYDYLHVGNFRGAVFYNLVRNWLEYLGYQVTYVYNYTDVDDRIINKANKENKSPSEISEHFIAEFQKDFQSLKLTKHDHNPKVTEYLEPIKQMVEALVEKGHAYTADGEVLYSITSFPGYGKLSGRNPEELKAGVRIEMDKKKRDPLDFALWKASKQGEPSWSSKWGEGRPGWHIECSAMVKALLGDQIDIHGGGLDLVFPHHENEIAQSEACTGRPLANYWMHHNMLNFSGAKMSKSVGNVRNLRAFVEEYHGEIYKFMILSSHYRSVAEFSETVIQYAVHGLARIYSALALAESVLAQNEAQENLEFKKITEAAWAKIEEALNDDFNTPEAFARLFETVRLFNSQVRRGQKDAVAKAKAVVFKDFVLKLGKLMSLFQEPPQAFLQSLDELLLRQKKIDKAEVEDLVKQRAQARTIKDFGRSDEIRDILLKMGISVSDTPEGSFWEVTK